MIFQQRSVRQTDILTLAVSLRTDAENPLAGLKVGESIHVKSTTRPGCPDYGNRRFAVMPYGGTDSGPRCGMAMWAVVRVR
jgi:hypothetical protein